MTGVNNISCLIDKTNESFRFAPFCFTKRWFNYVSIAFTSLHELQYCIKNLVAFYPSFVRFVREAPARSTDVSI